MNKSKSHKTLKQHKEMFKSKSSFFNRQKEFEKMPKYSFDIPVIQNSSKYVSKLEKERIEARP